MNKAEAVSLLDRQKAFLAENGHFAGLAPGVNGAQLRRAERILAGTEPENKPVVAQVFDDKGRAIGHGAEVVNGPLLPEVAVKKLAAAVAAVPAPAAPEAEPEPEAEEDVEIPEPEAEESGPKLSKRRGRK